ncbi:MAG: immunoglobulin domain-containing protein [Verrucomicrobiota bacterium]
MGTWPRKSVIAFLLMASASLVGAQSIQAIYSFTGGSNAQQPDAALTRGNDGNFYGTTQGTGSGGTLFRVTTNGALTTLASFNGANGAHPGSPLTLGGDGSFYGTMEEGGVTNSSFPSGMGTVFRVSLTLPGIDLQPQNQTNYAGATASFSVWATSIYALGYQWVRDGANLADGGNISGATSNILTITGISDSDASAYSVIVSNAQSSVMSSNALLTVLVPPSLTLQLLAGYPLLSLDGMLSNNFVVQYNTDLTVTNWITLLSLTNLPRSPCQFLDPAGVIPPARYYRAVMQ